MSIMDEQTSFFDDLSQGLALLDSHLEVPRRGSLVPDLIPLEEGAWESTVIFSGLSNATGLGDTAETQQRAGEDDANSVDDTSPSVMASGKEQKSDGVVEEVRGNVSHTRRCRAKVNHNFERLLEVLPRAPEGVEVKHKAQILAYAIEHVGNVRRQNIQLEMQLALSSRYEMQRWVHGIVAGSKGLTEALKPFMALICLTKKWKYAELWMPYAREGDRDGTALKYVSGALPPNVNGEEQGRLRRYRSHSRRYTFLPRCGVPGRVFLTMRPEWLPLLNDPVAFPRAPHAMRNKVQVTFAVPIIVNGSVQMVVEFYDTKRRDYDAGTVITANELGMMFGRAFTGMSPCQAHGMGGNGVL